MVKSSPIHENRALLARICLWNLIYRKKLREELAKLREELLSVRTQIQVESELMAQLDEEKDDNDDDLDRYMKQNEKALDNSKV